MKQTEAIEQLQGTPTAGAKVASVLRAFRHPLRAGAMALAALSLTWGLATTSGLVAAASGAVLGVIAGELLATRTRVHLGVLLTGLLLVLGLAWTLGIVAVRGTAIPQALGPGGALGFSAVLRYFAGALAVTGALRMSAARSKTLIGLELAVTAAAFAAVFSAHRDGVIARPLWLSDWAWQNGIDPVDVFLGVGACAVIVLAALLIAESERNVSLASFLALPVLAILAVLMLTVRGLPEPEAGNDLGLTDHEVGDPPLPTPEGGPNGGSGNQQDQQNGEQGEGQEQQNQGQSGGEGDQQQEQGQSGGGDQQEQQGEGGGGGQQQQQQGQGQGQGQQQQQGGGSSNKPQEPDLDQQQSQGQAPAPMAVVLFGDDYSPPAQAYYFRQEIWSHYNGSRLVASSRPDVDLDMIRSFPSADLEVREAPPVGDPDDPKGALRQEVHATVALLVEHKRPFALESVATMGPEPNPNPARFLRAYHFVSQSIVREYGALFGHDPGNSEWTDEQLAYYLEVPSDSRYGELAEELVADLPEEMKGDPFARALKVKLWMDENLAYSTSERHAGVADPTADFLFGNRIGYCVHFAHAAVYMWRSLGIPARVATGYHVEESSRRGSALIITGGNAHAWPELYLDGVGWVILDISAAENLDPPGEPVDEDLTKLLSDMARKDPDPEGSTAKSQGKRRNLGRMLGFGLLFVVIGALAVLYLIKVWRRVAPGLRGADRLPVLGYRKALDLLAESGMSREYGETRESFARRVAKELPSIDKLTSMHQAAKLGDPERPRDQRPELDAKAWRDAMSALRSERSKVVPVWRRILGLLDPLAFFRAR